MSEVEKRDGFSTKWGFILACIGSAVGMGNIWRFPVLVSAMGGMTFLIPYFLFVIFIFQTFRNMEQNVSYLQTLYNRYDLQ